MAVNIVYKQIKEVVAAECDVPVKDVTIKTPFMGIKGPSYFECMGILYTLEHTFHVSLPEADFYKYKTVGDLTNCIVRQLKNAEQNSALSQAHTNYTPFIYKGHNGQSK